jgi:hypothetical protein
MFVRFRQTKSRLQVSLVETRRVNGKVQHEHIAQLGAVETPLTIEGRLAFWQRLHERLAKLANRVDQGKILGDVHARIPMVALEDQHALKLQNAETNERFWSGLQDIHQDMVSGHKSLIAKTENAIAAGQAGAAEAAAKVAALKDRIERLKNGEDVPGFDKPLTREDCYRILHEHGIDPEDCVRFSQVCEVHGFEAVHEILTTERDRAERAAIRAMHRRIFDDE